MEVSAAIIVALAFALSPYILILGVALLLVTGVPKLPPFLRPVLPGPLIQVCSLSKPLLWNVTEGYNSWGNHQGLFVAIDSGTVLIHACLLVKLFS